MEKFAEFFGKAVEYVAYLLKALYDFFKGDVDKLEF